MEKDPALGGLLAELQGMWVEAIADHSDPVGALICGVEDYGGFPRFTEDQIFVDDTGGIDLLSLLIVVSMRRTGKRGPSAGNGDRA